MAQLDDMRVAEGSVEAERSAPAEPVYFPELLVVLAARKSLIVKFVGMAIILAVILSLSLRNTYTANAKIMPPQQNQSMLTSMLSQLGPLASLAGPGLGMRTPADLYVGML